jgi:hypothetical protein
MAINAVVFIASVEDLPPARGRGLGCGQDRRDEESDGRHEPEQGDHGEEDLERQLADRAQDLRGERVLTGR